MAVVVAVVAVVAGVIVRVSLIIPEHPLESVAVTVIGKLPVCAGVPLRTPATKVMPVGKVPVSEKVIAPTPPVCAKATGP